MRCLSARLPYRPHIGLQLRTAATFAPAYRAIFSRIILASPMLSVTTDVKRGDGLLMSFSLASRIAAMIDAAITSVEANRSVIRFCSSIAFALSCSSRAIARFISPISYRRSAIRGGFDSRSWDSRPRKMSAVRYRLFSQQSGHSATIHEFGKVCTGAAKFC